MPAWLSFLFCCTVFSSAYAANFSTSKSSATEASSLGKCHFHLGELRFRAPISIISDHLPSNSSLNGIESSGLASHYLPQLIKSAFFDIGSAMRECKIPIIIALKNHTAWSPSRPYTKVQIYFADRRCAKAFLVNADVVRNALMGNKEMTIEGA